MKTFVTVDTHPEGGGWLTQPASLEVVGTFATAHQIAVLMDLAVGEIYHHQAEANRGIERVS